MDHSQPDGRPRCFHKACAELADWCGRKVDQSGSQGKNALEKAQLKAYGILVPVYTCQAHMIEANAQGVHEFQPVPGRHRRKPAPKENGDQLLIPGTENL